MINLNKFTSPKKLVSSGVQPEFLPKSKAFIMVVTIIALTLFLSQRFIWKPIFEINTPAPKNIYAGSDFNYRDFKTTQLRINQVIKKIKPPVKKQKKISDNMLASMNKLIDHISVVKYGTSNDSYLDSGNISPVLQDYMYSLNQPEWNKYIYKPSIKIFGGMLKKNLPPDIKKPALHKLIKENIPSNIPPQAAEAINQIVSASFLPDAPLLFSARQKDSPREISIKRQIDDLYNINRYKGTNLNTIKDNVDTFALILSDLERYKNINRLYLLAYSTLPDNIRTPLKNISQDQWTRLKDIILNCFEQMVNKGLSTEEIKNLNSIIHMYTPDNLDDNENNLIYSVINTVARPNIIIDQDELSKLQQEAVKSVRPAFVKIKKGDLLVKKGQIISRKDIKILTIAGLLEKKIYWSGVYEIFSIVTILVFVFSFYIFLFARGVFNSLTYLWLISLAIIISTGISVLLVDSYPYFLPLAVSSGVIAMFIDRKTALSCLIFAAILYYKGFNIDTITLIALASGSIASIIMLYKIGQRINILKAGIIIGFVQIITFNFATIVLEINQIDSQLNQNQPFLNDSGLWFLSGIVFSMVILAILPVIEEFFGLITYSRLTELGDFNQPLIRELEEIAPGTFQHSLAVATLSEYAARKLNLDSTLCRVGSYYHDVGKMLKPQYFVENQIDDTNPHDELNDPYKSAKIIVSHARAGVSIARKHKLPPSLISFMTEHHGTCLVGFFFYQAKQQAGLNAKVDESFFRYFGPKPLSKETAVVMLADSSEAAVRAIKDKGHLSIRNKVKEIVAEKLNDGQLSDSGLTTEEIAVIIDSFTFTVLEIHHKRIEYPK